MKCGYCKGCFHLPAISCGGWWTGEEGGGGKWEGGSEVGKQRTPQVCGGGTEIDDRGSLEEESELCWRKKMRVDGVLWRKTMTASGGVRWWSENREWDGGAGRWLCKRFSLRFRMNRSNVFGHIRRVSPCTITEILQPFIIFISEREREVGERFVNNMVVLIITVDIIIINKAF